ncbi:Post-translational flagellin modification protein B [Magnetospirillum gryphiswaldense MSR-1 v2]|uniref:Post-translational flagellin modification protein B n=1 Tax=Magnetospirillum gryphiswaldense (strain DSM 6361 / JCM 21280 / NBRC 15271 / MSR-1) TaxID=431944 RepID=V6F813_MAGGM|nr:acylneuraminate cytidylyltransferase family protein [Magnetospirillum gryphiswaldense]CDL00628.1 Post-translational flagellin modification protein B [Magnetospirillum gryphiswaldense MSR-1 v2]
MKRLCTICARGGSKGLPSKNIRLLEGKPLIAHTIEQAKRLRHLFVGIAVSSDSEEILAVAREYGVDFAIRRPDSMATDTASKLPPIQHAVEAVEAALSIHIGAIVDLDPTSPLRGDDDVVGAVALFDKTGCQSVLTGAPARKSPYFNQMEWDEGGFVRLVKPLANPPFRRQDGPQVFDMNAAVYVWRRDRFMVDPKVFYEDSQLFVMPEERSWDIDNLIDFEFVQLMMAKEKQQ